MSATFEEMLAEYRFAVITNQFHISAGQPKPELDEEEKSAKAALLKYDADSRKEVDHLKTALHIEKSQRVCERDNLVHDRSLLFQQLSEVKEQRDSLLAGLHEARERIKELEGR